MQCLSAPTREEVDWAHFNGRTFNIGLSSIFNMKYMKSWKTALWFSLGLSSLPIHLLLNSAFFGSLQANNYGVMVVTGDFKEDPTWNLCSMSDSRLLDPAPSFACEIYSLAMDPNSNITLLNSTECIIKYGNPLQGTASNLILVSTDERDKYVISENGELSNFC